MRKKLGKILCSFVLILLVSGGIYYFNVYNSVEEISIHADYVTYSSEKELSNAADIILYGSPIDKFEDRKHENKYTSDGSLYDFYTLTKFKVKKVIKNSTSLSINKTDFFEIIEPIGVEQQVDGKKVLELDSYKAMVENNNYIVFLKSNNIGGYSIINMSNGKFNTDNDGSKDDKKHLDFRKEVLSKYLYDIAN